MNSAMTRRLERLEERRHRHFEGIAFFEHTAGVYLHTVTGISYTPHEYRALVERYETCAFMCVDRDYEPPPEFSSADLQNWNRAVDQATSEGRPFDPATDPDPAVREFHRATEAYEAAGRARRLASHHGWITQLERLKRPDLIRLEHDRIEQDRKQDSKLEGADGSGNLGLDRPGEEVAQFD